MTFFQGLIFSEISFSAGLIIVIIYSGALKIRLRDFFKFDFSKINIRKRGVYIGFTINRISAAVPTLYLLYNGWGKFPPFIQFAILIELGIVLYLTYIPFNRSMMSSFN